MTENDRQFEVTAIFYTPSEELGTDGSARTEATLFIKASTPCAAVERMRGHARELGMVKGRENFHLTEISEVLSDEKEPT